MVLLPRPGGARVRVNSAPPLPDPSPPHPLTPAREGSLSVRGSRSSRAKSQEQSKKSPKEQGELRAPSSGAESKKSRARASRPSRTVHRVGGLVGGTYLRPEPSARVGRCTRSERSWRGRPDRVPKPALQKSFMYCSDLVRAIEVRQGVEIRISRIPDFRRISAARVLPLPPRRRARRGSHGRTGNKFL